MFQPAPPISVVKLEIFVPPSHFPALQQALQEVDAGHIGAYDSCLSYQEVHSCWRPLPGAHPFLGQENTLSQEIEYKVEVCCKVEQLDQTLRAIRRVHPYEEPVVNIIPLWGTGLDLTGLQQDPSPNGEGA